MSFVAASRNDGITSIVAMIYSDAIQAGKIARLDPTTSLVAHQHAELAALLEADDVTLIQLERIMELRQKGNA